MPLPVIDEASRKRPLCYDPERRIFIYYDQIVSGEEKIIPLAVLTDRALKKLVIKRLMMLPEDTKMISLNGQIMTRDSMVQAVKQEDPDGVEILQMEKSYLEELLNEIQDNLP